MSLRNAFQALRALIEAIRRDFLDAFGRPKARYETLFLFLVEVRHHWQGLHRPEFICRTADFLHRPTVLYALEWSEMAIHGLLHDLIAYSTARKHPSLRVQTPYEITL